jgi:Fe-S-cluster containining protein
LVPTACALTNALVERAIQGEAQAGHTLSCRAGCGACCRQMVPLSPPEAFYLMDVIDALEPARRGEVLQQFDDIVNVLDQRGMIDRLLDPQPSDEPALPVAREYFSLGLACPFLVDESCGIHPHRPVACRDYNVTSPVEWCARPYEHEVAKVPLPLPLSVPLSRLAASVAGIRPCLVPLTLVPRWVQQHRELRSRRWSGPDLFDRFLAELGCAHSNPGGT